MTTYSVALYRNVEIAQAEASKYLLTIAFKMCSEQLLYLIRI